MWTYYCGLSGLDRVFMICAVLGGLLFLIRNVMMFVGHDNSGHDGAGIHVDDFSGGHAGGLTGGDSGDGSAHGDSSSDTSFHLLSLQSITVFFLMFGLVGLCIHIGLDFQKMPIGDGLAIIGAGIGGFIAIWIVGAVMSYMAMLQSSGTISLHNAVGQNATVYLHIPAGGTGKVNVTVQGRLQVLDAIAEDKQLEIATGTDVEVTDVRNNILVVRRPKT